MVTVAGATAEAVAVRVTGVATLAVAPAAGLVSVTLGGLLTAVTVTGAEVPTLPLESVTRTVNAELPAALGVHAVE